MDLVAVVNQVRQYWLEFDREQRESPRYHLSRSLSEWNSQWDWVCLPTQQRGKDVRQALAKDKQLVRAMRKHQSFFIQSGFSAAYPGLVHAQPWDVHCDEISDVATHEGKYNEFITRVSGLPPPPATTPFTILQVLFEANRGSDTDIPSIRLAKYQREHSPGEAYANGMSASIEATHHGNGPCSTSKLRHGNMRMTDEAMVDIGQAGRTNEFRHGKMRTTDEAIVEMGQARRTDEFRHGSMRMTDEAMANLGGPARMNEPSYEANPPASPRSRPTYEPTHQDIGFAALRAGVNPRASGVF